jgi:hypothetical protein
MFWKIYTDMGKEQGFFIKKIQSSPSFALLGFRHRQGYGGQDAGQVVQG